MDILSKHGFNNDNEMNDILRGKPNNNTTDQFL